MPCVGSFAHRFCGRIIAMKTHMRRTAASVLLSHAYPSPMKQIEAPAGSVARVKTQLQISSDGAIRIARIEMLKAQVDAGTYITDSQAIAQKMLFFLFKDESEQYMPRLSQRYK
jgi:anti-sigma28 factor (negative regulator of flagellin synthesis)